jgi:hypothetical protein
MSPPGVDLGADGSLLRNWREARLRLLLRCWRYRGRIATRADRRAVRRHRSVTSMLVSLALTRRVYSTYAQPAPLLWVFELAKQVR